MRRSFIICALVALTAVVGVPANAQSIQQALPGAKKVSGVVPAMGEHWVHRKYPGAVFGQMNGKIVFIEYEIMKKDLVGTKEVRWDNFTMPGFIGKIDHTDIEYMPKGHRDMEVPHITIHMYTVPHAEHMAYKPPPPK